MLLGDLNVLNAFLRLYWLDGAELAVTERFGARSIASCEKSSGRFMVKWTAYFTFVKTHVHAEIHGLKTPRSKLKGKRGAQ
jgi:hypothetical protein